MAKSTRPAENRSAERCVQNRPAGERHSGRSEAKGAHDPTPAPLLSSALPARGQCPWTRMRAPVVPAALLASSSALPAGWQCPWMQAMSGGPRRAAMVRGSSCRRAVSPATRAAAPVVQLVRFSALPARRQCSRTQRLSPMVRRMEKPARAGPAGACLVTDASRGSWRRGSTTPSETTAGRCRRS